MSEKLWWAILFSLLGSAIMILGVGMLSDGGVLDQLVELRHETERFHAPQ